MIGQLNGAFSNGATWTIKHQPAVPAVKAGWSITTQGQTVQADELRTRKQIQDKLDSYGLGTKQNVDEVEQVVETANRLFGKTEKAEKPAPAKRKARRK